MRNVKIPVFIGLGAMIICGLALQYLLPRIQWLPYNFSSLILTSVSFIIGFAAKPAISIFFHQNLKISEQIFFRNEDPSILLLNRLNYPLLDVRVYFELLSFSAEKDGQFCIIIKHVDSVSLPAILSGKGKIASRVYVPISQNILNIWSKSENRHMNLNVRVLSLHPVSTLRAVTDDNIFDYDESLYLKSIDNIKRENHTKAFCLEIRTRW